MTFSKQFPKTFEGLTKWQEVFLSYEEEITAEDNVRKENIKLMKECIKDAKSIMDNTGLKDYQSDLISIAKSLFEKRSSHEIYWKEKKAKEKFDSKNDVKPQL